jgi:glycosyltransferase involved in cell wall biosynthesis
MNLAIVAPVYNEAGCIRDFVLEWLPVARNHAPAALFLIDDGSRDGSSAILDELAAAHHEIHVVHQPNQGHGAAIRRGYELALESAAEWIFQTDSDRQFAPDDFARLWDQRLPAQFLVGIRTGRSDPAARRFLSKANRLVLALLFGVHLSDPNSPFRLMRSGFLARVLERIPRQVFAPNVLITVEAARSGAVWLEIPVAHRERATGIISIRGWSSARLAARCLREWLAYRMGH